MAASIRRMLIEQALLILVGLGQKNYDRPLMISPLLVVAAHSLF